MSDYHEENSRSLFWPIMLIGIGVLFLMQNLGYVDQISWILLLRVWPVLLVAAGINILFRNVRWVGTIVGGLVAAGILAFLYFAPQLGLDEVSRPDMRTESLSAALENAETAEIKLDLDYGRLTVAGVADSDNLLEATATHRDEFTLDNRGDEDKRLVLRLDASNSFDPTRWFNSDETTVEVGLSTLVPIDLNIDQGSGISELDLSELELVGFNADNGSGTLNVALPGGEYPVKFSSGSGTLDIHVMAEATLDMIADVGSGRIAVTFEDGVQGEMSLDVGSGSIRVTVPSGVGVQLTGSTGSGSVSVPSDFVKTSGFDNDSGTWESPNFDEQEFQIVIRFDVGSGRLVVQE